MEITELAPIIISVLTGIAGVIRAFVNRKVVPSGDAGRAHPQPTINIVNSPGARVTIRRD